MDRWARDGRHWHCRIGHRPAPGKDVEYDPAAYIPAMTPEQVVEWMAANGEDTLSGLYSRDVHLSLLRSGRSTGATLNGGDRGLHAQAVGATGPQTPTTWKLPSVCSDLHRGASNGG